MIASVVLLFGCGEDEPSPPTTPRTVLVYMVATNTLGSNHCDEVDIAEMDKAVAANGLNGCKLLVYHASYSGDPQLFSIEKSGGVAVHRVLATYTDGKYSTNPERMRQVINDVRALAPAADYGLVLWGHGTGWALSLADKKASTLRSIDKSMPLTRSFGPDYGKYMPVDELVSALPDGMFSFIYADICYFGSVEIAYQLRAKTRYFIGSASSLPAAGMPYDENIECFTATTPQLRQACENTYWHYNNLTGEARSLTISLVDCAQLTQLAATCHAINALGTTTDPDDIQHYVLPADGYNIYFDLRQYYAQLSASEPGLAAAFDAVLDKSVLYKATTGSIFDRLTIDPEHFSGLSTYILGTASTANEEYYYTLDWYKSVY